MVVAKTAHDGMRTPSNGGMSASVSAKPPANGASKYGEYLVVGLIFAKNPTDYAKGPASGGRNK